MEFKLDIILLCRALVRRIQGTLRLLFCWPKLLAEDVDDVGSENSYKARAAAQ